MVSSVLHVEALSFWSTTSTVGTVDPLCVTLLQGSPPWIQLGKF